MWKCPRCENEIENLDYSVQTREWGYVNLSEPEDENSQCDTENYESNDSEWTGDTSFSCPECSNDIELDELIPVINEEEKKKTTNWKKKNLTSSLQRETCKSKEKIYPIIQNQ